MTADERGALAFLQANVGFTLACAILLLGIVLVLDFVGSLPTLDGDDDIDYP